MPPTTMMPAVTPAPTPMPTNATRPSPSTYSLWQQLFRYVSWDHQWKYVLVYILLLLVVYPLEKIGIPYLVSTFLVKWKPGGATDTLWQACVGVVAAFALITGVWSILYYVELSMQQHLWMDTKATMVHDVFRLYRRDNHEMPLGRWLTHIENVPYLTEQIFYKIIGYIVPETIGILVVFGYFTYIDVGLGLGSFAFLALIALYFLLNIYGSQVIAREEYAQHAEFNQRVHNTLENMAYIQTAQSHGFELKRFARDVAAFMGTKRRFCWRNSWFLAGIDLLIFAFLAFVVFWTYRQLTTKGVSVAQAVLLTSVFVVLVGEARDMDYLKSLFTELYNYTYKSQVFLEERDGQKHRPMNAGTRVRGGNGPAVVQERQAPSHASPALRATGLTFRYPRAARPTLDGLSLAFAPRQLHAIVGPAGCGKSTCAKILAGIHVAPQAGRIVLFGRDVTHDVDARRNAVVYLPQHVKLFEGTILDNLRYTRTDLRAAQVRDILRAYGVERTLQQHAKDSAYLERAVGVNGGGVSGGQKQIIMLVRTCIDVGATREIERQRGHPTAPPTPLASASSSRHTATHKSILFFDEPTASLDPEMVDVVVALLRRLAESRTVIVITHDHRVARACDTRATFG